jgi:hypothetical protein
MKLFIFDPKKRKNVLCGDYDEISKTFTKKVTNKHFFIKFKSYGIQEEIILKLDFLGCKFIEIKTKKSIFITKLENWKEGKICDFGHGKQVFINTNYIK